MSKIICIRMTSGEEVIGTLIENTILAGNIELFDGNGPFEPTGNVTLSAIRAINFQPLNRDEFEIIFTPYALGNSEANLTFKLDNCAAAVYVANEEIATGYLQQTAPVPASRPGIKM
jgi:hypothetical protein